MTISNSERAQGVMAMLVAIPATLAVLSVTAAAFGLVV